MTEKLVKKRFSNVSLAEIDTNIEKNRPINTIKTHKYIWKQFSEFCCQKNYALNENCSDENLAVILKDWAFNMRKTDGTHYKESTVKTIWNNTAMLLQQKYYVEFNRKIDPFRSVVFQSARNARNTIRRQLQSVPESRKNSAAALSKEDIHNILQQFDENTPDGLQKKIYHIAAVELAWRGGEAVNCKLKYFKEETNNDGSITGRIQYNPIFSKTSQGGDKRLSDTKWLTSNIDNPNFCPVRLFKKMISKRTNNITTDRLFLTVNINWKSSDKWYKNTPIGRNEISKWTKSSASLAGINTKFVKITNHSNRSAAVSQLANAGISEQEIIKITGHTSSHSIKPYLQMDATRHLQIISHLRNSSISDPTTSSHIEGNSLNNKNPNIIYNNCTFNVFNK